MMFLVLVLVRELAECFLQLHMDNLCKVFAFASLFFQVGLTCTPIHFDRSTILIKTMAIMCIVAFGRPSMLVAQHSVIFSPAHLLGFLGDVQVH
jgi:hypothetical protein